MNCPKCGKEVGEEKVCSNCGAQINPTGSNGFETVEGEKKKKTNKVLFVIIALIVVAIAVVAYYVLKINTPRYIFDKKIDEFLTISDENQEYKTMKVNADLEVSLNSKEEGTEEISNLINDAKLSINSEVDTEKQEEIVGIKLTKASDELINARAKIEAESQNMYISLGKLFEKTIQMDMSEISDEEFQITDVTASTFGQKVTAKKAEQILRQEVKSQLKDEYFSTEKATIDDQNVTNNKLRLSGKQFTDVIKNSAKNLSENEEFIDCYEDGEEMKEYLQEIVDAVDELDMPEDVYIEINVYTLGINKAIKRVDVVIEEDSEKVTIEIKKVNDEEYEYTAKSGDEKAFDGKIKIQGDDNNFSLELSVNVEGTEVKVKLSGNVVYDEALSDFDTSNSVKYDELTSEDQYELIENLMNSKIYEIIEEISGSNTSLIDDGDDDIIDTDDEKDKDKDEPKTQTSSKLEDNVVKTYDDDVIKFNIPDGFEIYSSDSEYYKLFEKELEDGSIDVDVATEYSTLDEYVEDIKDKKESYEGEEEYKNIEISDVEDIEVNGNKFKKVTISYDYSFSEERSRAYNEVYIACEIDSDNLYTVEIDGENLMTDDELKAFLTIEK